MRCADVWLDAHPHTAAFMGIGTSLILCFVVLSMATCNPLMAFHSVFTIMLIVVDIFACTVLFGFKLGVLEAVNYVVVIGMSIDYCVHMSEAYNDAHRHTAVPKADDYSERERRVLAMLAEMAVSVISGAISTLGCVAFMFPAPNDFFLKFAAFVCSTIFASCLYSLVFFPALLATFGPQGGSGDMRAGVRALCHWFATRSW